MDLAQLTYDCRTAAHEARVAADGVSDGGSANLDSTFLCLPKGVRSARIVHAIAASGLSARPSRWLGRGIFIDAPARGQGDKRATATEALSRSLKDAGWDVLTYHQMD